MKATEQYFPVVLFNMLHKVVLTFEPVGEILKCDHSTESCWAVRSGGTVNMLHKVVLTFEPVGEILKCDHSTESCWAVLSCGAVYYDVHRASKFWVCGWNPMMWPFKWNLLSSTFLWYCLLCCTRWITLTFHPRQKEAITMAAFLVLWYRCRS